MSKKGFRLQEEQRRQFRNIKRKIPTFHNFELITLKKQELRWTFPPPQSHPFYILLLFPTSPIMPLECSKGKLSKQSPSPLHCFKLESSFKNGKLWMCSKSHI